MPLWMLYVDCDLHHSSIKPSTKKINDANIFCNLIYNVFDFSMVYLEQIVYKYEKD